MSDDATTERHIDLDVGRIRVRESGDGPTVLLVHGALVNSHLWDDVIPLLADRHRGLDRERLDLMFEPPRRSRDVRRDVVRLLRSMDAADTQAAAAALGDVTIPVLVAWSADDRIFPPEHASRLAGLLPHATVSPIADSLAFSPIDQPAALAQRIAEFSGQAA